MKRIISIIVTILTTMTLNAQTTIILQPGNLDGKDAWIWSYDPFENINFGESNVSNSGFNNVIRSEVWVWGSVADTIRGILDFDLSSVPAKSTITDAKLSLFFFANSGFTQQTGQNDLLIQRVTQSWTETGITWNNKPSTSVTNQKILPRSNSRTQDYLNIDVTALVQDMIDSSSSHGFMLQMLDEVTFKGLTFASSEHPDTSLHPKLEITYKLTSGISDRDEIKDVFINYPNPSSKFIIVEFAKSFPEKIDIFNINGRIVKSIKVNTKTIPIDLEDMPAGIYFLNFNLMGTNISKKFIKE